MSENKNSQPQEEGTEVASSKKKRDPVKTFIYILLVLIVVFFSWYVAADRHTPYTDQAKIVGLAIPIAPRVSGYLTKINIKLHSEVEAGDTLFIIDQRPFKLAIARAEANLDNTEQMVGARTATVKSAVGRLGVARAQKDRAKRNFDRVQVVLRENPGAIAQADKDAAETSLMQATEQVSSAEADLDKAEQQLGISGPENAQYRAAVVALEQAQLDLAFTHVVAPASGFIESFNVDLGYYSQAGQSLGMLVSSSDLWIQANMKENNLSNISAGDSVEFILDIEPGAVFKGHISSIGYGVNDGYSDRTQLPTTESSSGWLRDPQRFPVIVTFDSQLIDKSLRLGGQVDVAAYSEEHKLLNRIARFRIRLNSYLSYLR